MNLELKKAIDQICKDRGLDRNMLIETLQEAVRTSVLRRYSEDIDVEVTYNEETGDIEVYQSRSWCLTTMWPTRTRRSPFPMPGSTIPRSSSTTRWLPREHRGSRRIAAQSAKQVIIQGLREAEHGMVYDEFNSKQHEILTGTVSRIDPRTGNVSLRIGTAPSPLRRC